MVWNVDGHLCKINLDQLVELGHISEDADRQVATQLFAAPGGTQ